MKRMMLVVMFLLVVSCEVMGAWSDWEEKDWGFRYTWKTVNQDGDQVWCEIYTTGLWRIYYYVAGLGTVLDARSPEQLAAWSGYDFEGLPSVPEPFALAGWSWPSSSGGPTSFGEDHSNTFDDLNRIFDWGKVAALAVTLVCLFAAFGFRSRKYVRSCGAR